jgi:bacillithiol biosynthesis deacetylase BshB1
MIDILAFAPHPDDVEIHCAGTLARLKGAGHSIGIVDLTRGELSTRGDPDTRAAETAEATRILGLDFRTNLGIPDGAIDVTPENRRAVIRVLRETRPRTVLLPYHTDRHPDHENASRLLRACLFLSGLRKIEFADEGGDLAPHRPKKAFHYMMAHTFQPDFIVDVSETFDLRLRAIQAYRSQIDPSYHNGEHQTILSSDDFIPYLVGRAKSLGFQIGAAYGEGFEAIAPLAMPTEGLV